jgi:hypothetical protein
VLGLPAPARLGRGAVRRANRRLVPAAALVAVAIVLPGCGSSEKNEGETPAAWADGLCGALTTWKDSLASVGSSLKDFNNLSKAKVEQAAKDVSDANAKLEDDLKALGKPQTNVPEAKETVDSLTEDLKTSAGKIEDAAKGVTSASDIPQAVTAASGAFLQMSSDASASIAKLKSLDSTDEWKKAFADSKSCQSLTKG